MVNLLRNIILLWMSMGIWLFIFVDVTLIPLGQSRQQVVHLKSKGPANLNPSFSQFTLYTAAHQYPISSFAFRHIEPGDSVVIYYSRLSSTHQLLGYGNGAAFYREVVSYTRREAGLVLMGMLALANIMLLVFYKRIQNTGARTNVSLFFIIVALFFMLVHFY